jgi:hypothetical protein
MQLPLHAYTAWFGSSSSSSSNSIKLVAGRDAAGFRAKAGHHRTRCRSSDFLTGGVTAEKPPQQQQQRLDAAGISQLVRCNPSLLQLLGSAENLSVQELLDGVINVVYAGA